MERKREKKGLIKSQVVLLLPLLLLLLLPASQTRYKGTLCIYSSGSGNLHFGEGKVYQGVRFFYTCLHTLPSTLHVLYVPSNILLGIRAIIIIDIVMDKGSPSSSRGFKIFLCWMRCAIVSARATYLPTLPTYLTD